MKTYLVYKNNSEHARSVIDFLRDFERQTGRSISTVDPETPSGQDLCAVYDIVEYPTIISTDDNGVMQSSWRGLPLPTISEVSYYA